MLILPLSPSQETDRWKLQLLSPNPATFCQGRRKEPENRGAAAWGLAALQEWNREPLVLSSEEELLRPQNLHSDSTAQT
jgi:hypothetical protein